MRKYLLLLAFLWTFSAVQAQIFILPLVKNSACGNNGGSIEVFVGGGSFPYTYSWTNGATSSLNSNLSAGSYRVFVTDAVGDTSSQQADVFNDAYIETAYGFLDYDPGFNFYYSCRSVCNGGYRAVEGLFNGTAPYTFTALNGTQSTLPNNDGIEFLGHCTGDTVKVLVTDANGCQGNFNQLLYGPTHPEMRLLDVSGTCNNGNAGSAVFRIPNENGFTGNVTYEVYSFNTGINPVQPTAQSGVYTAANLPQGHYYLNRVYSSAHQNCEDDTLEFDVPNYGENCASLSGIVWEDVNGDCSYDSVLEQGVAYQLLEVMPGNSYAVSNAQGKYSINLPFGFYTVRWVKDTVGASCGSSGPINFSLTYNNSAVVQNLSRFPASSCNQFTSLTAGSNTTSPGSNYSVQLHFGNSGISTANNSKLYYYYNPLSTFLSASINPDSTGNGVLMWNIGSIAQNSSGFLSMNFLLSGAISQGSNVSSHSTIISSTSDDDYSNNTHYLNFTVGAPFFEANKKYVYDEIGNEINVLYVDLDNTLNYTINFQNTNADTAYSLTIIDTLSQFVDLTSLQLIASSHNCLVSIDSARIARFTFPSLLLPPAAIDEAGSKGFVRYAIDVPPGFAQFLVHVYNQASILFDENTPIESNLTDVFIDQMSGLAHYSGIGKAPSIFPNPVNDILNVALNEASGTTTKLQIFSMDGRLLLEQTTNNGRAQLDVNDLTSGTYLLRCISDNQSANRLFVKN